MQFVLPSPSFFVISTIQLDPGGNLPIPFISYPALPLPATIRAVYRTIRALYRCPAEPAAM